MADVIGGVKDVREYGAKGDGEADDTLAIQEAVDNAEEPYSDVNRGTIWFPGGTYKVTQPIELPTNIRAFALRGSPGTLITGNFEGALVERPYESPYGGTYVIEGLGFKNYHKRGTDVIAHSMIALAVRNCAFGGHIGIETFNSQAVTLDTCQFIRDGGTELEGSVGVLAGNATSLFNCDVTGYGDGVRHQNLGMCVIGGRYEVNGRAIVLGINEKGETFQSTGVFISGLSMESNDHGIWIQAGGAVKIDACAITNNVEGKSSGIHVHDGEEIMVGANSISSGTHGFTEAAVFLNNPKQSVFFANRINVGKGVDWRMPEDPTTRNLFFAANLPPAPGA